MSRKYHDLYALFRHDRNAEEYFEELPGAIQDRVRAYYQSVDSFQRLLSMVERERHRL